MTDPATAALAGAVLLVAALAVHALLATQPPSPDPHAVVTNLGGKRFSGPGATASRRPLLCCRSRGLAALLSSATPLSAVAVVRSALAALTRALCCSRYAGPAAHPAARGVHYAYGVADAVGRRDYMEDRHLGARLAVPPQLRGALGGGEGDARGPGGCSVYGVYDGHSGAQAAECVAWAGRGGVGQGGWGRRESAAASRGGKGGRAHLPLSP